MDILPGPLATIGQAIQTRLQALLPPNRFTYQWLPGKMDLKTWELLIRRTPSVSLEFAGFEAVEITSGLIGTGVWCVWLAIKNPASAEAALFGDTLGQGILAVQQVAMAGLHGMAAPGGGTIVIGKAEPVAMRDRDDPGVFVTCLTVQVNRITIDPRDVVAGDILTMGTLVTETIAWNFGTIAAPAMTDTIITGSA